MYIIYTYQIAIVVSLYIYNDYIHIRGISLYMTIILCLYNATKILIIFISIEIFHYFVMCLSILQDYNFKNSLSHV
jgi:hypothetical protein